MRSLGVLVLAALAGASVATSIATAGEPVQGPVVCTNWASPSGTPEKNRENLEEALNAHLAAGRSRFYSGYTPSGISLACAW
jgi:hypothetical protein